MTAIRISDLVRTDYGIGRFQGMEDGLYKVTIDRHDWTGGDNYPGKFNQKSPTINVSVEKVEPK